MELILKRTSDSRERDRLYDGDAFIGWVDEVRIVEKGWSNSRLRDGVYTIADPYIVHQVITELSKRPFRALALTLAYDELPPEATAVLFQVYSRPRRTSILYSGTYTRIMELVWLAGVLKEGISIRICQAGIASEKDEIRDKYLHQEQD